jgi:hypothetical protein
VQRKPYQHNTTHRCMHSSILHPCTLNYDHMQLAHFTDSRLISFSLPPAPIPSNAHHLKLCDYSSCACTKTLVCQSDHWLANMSMKLSRGVSVGHTQVFDVIAHSYSVIIIYDVMTQFVHARATRPWCVLPRHYPAESCSQVLVVLL